MAKKGISARRLTMLGYGACALAGCLWGTGFYFGRLALNEMSVEHMVLYRFLFASVGLLPMVWVYRKQLRFTGSELRTLLICAALGIPIQFLLQFHGLARTTVSHASLMVGSLPVLLAVAATLFAGERLDLLGWLALWGSTLGTALIVLGGKRGLSAQGDPTLAGDLMVVASLLIAMAWILLSKKLMQTHTPSVVTACTILSGTAMLVVLVVGPSLLELPIPSSWLGYLRISRVAPPPSLFQISGTACAALVISGLFCTAATTLLWNWGINHAPASRAGVFLNLEPALGSVLGVELLGEHLGPHAWFGGALILGAALVLTSRGNASESEIVLE
jgi:drug/metabolite transporter (DMT)-like permease